MASTSKSKTGDAGMTTLGIELQAKKDEALALYNEVKDLDSDKQRERLDELRAFAPFNENIAFLVAELDGLAAQYDKKKPAHQQPQDMGQQVTGDVIREEIASEDKKPEAVSAKGDKNPNDKDSDVTTDSGNGKVDAKDATSDEGSSKPNRGPRGNQSGKRSRTDDRRPRTQRAPFIVVFAMWVKALVTLLKRPAPFSDLGPRKGNLRVDRKPDGRTRIRVKIGDREHDIVVPGVAVNGLVGALEDEIPGDLGHGINLHWFDDDNVRITAQESSSGQATPPREDRERRPARQPGPRNDSPSMRTEGDFRSSELPSPRRDKSSPQSGSGIAPKKRDTKPHASGSRASKPTVKPAKFPQGFQRAASSSIALFLSGDTDLGFEITDAMINGDATAAALEISDDGIIRDVRWVHGPVCEAMTATYVGTHPLAPMMDQQDRVAKLRDREGIPAVRTESGVFAMPFTQDAARTVKLTVDAVLKACAAIVRATDWANLFTWFEASEALPAKLTDIKVKIREEANVSNVQKGRLNRWLNKTFGEGNWEIDGDVVNSTLSAGLPADDHLNANGAGINFESVKHAFGGTCSVEFDGCNHASNKVLLGFGRVWTACKACALGYFDALNQRVADRLEEHGIGAFDNDPLAPSNFIFEWPRLSDPESMKLLTPQRDGSWPKWVPKTDDEAYERLLDKGPFVITGPRSWGFDALSGRFELKLTHLCVVQRLEDDTDVFDVYPISSASASALVTANMATLEHRPHSVGNDTATYLIDRSVGLDRRPKSAQQQRISHERHVEKKVNEQFDMSPSERDDAREKRDTKRGERRDGRNEMKAEIKVGMGWYSSDWCAEIQEAAADRDERSTRGTKKKSSRKADKSAKSKAERDRMKGEKRNDDSKGPGRK